MPINREPFLKRRCNHLANTVSLGKVLHGGVHKRLQRVVARGKGAGRGGTDVADRQRGDHPPQIRVTCGLKVGQQLLASSVDCAVFTRVRAGLLQVFLGEVEQLRLIFKHTGRDQVLSALLPQCLNVKDTAGCDVLKPRRQLRRTGAGVGAAPVGVPLLRRGQLRATRRAILRVDEFALGAVAKISNGAQDLRDDLAGLAHHHRVPDQDSLALDLVLVVQGGHGDRGARDKHRL